METPDLDDQQKHCREDIEHQLPTVEEVMDTYNLDDPQVAAEIRRWKERHIRWFQDQPEDSPVSTDALQDVSGS